MAKPRSSGRDWRLGNAEELHRANPRSFFIPPPAQRRAVPVGGYVRLSFFLADPSPGQPQAERMWLVVRRRRFRRYVGELTNQPVEIDDLMLGDLVGFGPQHIIAVDDPRWAQYGTQRAFVNRRLLEDESIVPGFVVHDPTDVSLAPQTDGTTASGWQLLVGDETEDELEDPSNVRTPNLGWLMERYPPFGDLVVSGASDGEWILDPDSSTYRSAS